MKIKTCSSCKKELPTIDFGKHKIMSDGLNCVCKICNRAKVNFYGHTKNGLITRIYAHQRRNSKKRNHPFPLYSKKGLAGWLDSQVNFDCLYLNWINSGYKKLKTPSVDRLDDYKPYSLDNIRLVIWEENLKRSHSDIKSGINNKLSKSIIQTNLLGNIIRKFRSSCYAHRETGVNQRNISSCCLGNRATAGGYKWNFLIEQPCE